LLQAVSACLADLVSAAVVFVVGCDISDALVEPHAVAVVSDAFELSGEICWLGERFEVGVLGLDVPEQGLDPCLVGRGGGPPEVLGDRADGHELCGVAGAHLGAVVGHRRQQRDAVAVGRFGVGVREAGGEPLGSDSERQVVPNDWKNGKLDGDDYERINNLRLCSIGMPMQGLC